MISKAKIKFIHELEQKKKRNEQGVFVAEGPKVVGDFMLHFPPVMFIATAEWAALHRSIIADVQGVELIEVTPDELAKVSFLQHPQEVLAVFRQRKASTGCLLKDEVLAEAFPLTLMLDGVQDPGNLGTIIRIADWFGIERVICSRDTADVYNPKVVQATMGSLARVQIDYADIAAVIDQMPEGIPVYGTLLDGNDLYAEPDLQSGIIVMGNEGNGISPEVRQKITHRLLIPNYPEGQATAESLNVAVATAVVCSEFRRRMRK